MSFLLHENYQFFLDINRYAGHWPWLDGVMIFFANTMIFFWPVFLLLLWGRPRAWRRHPLRPGEAAIIQECRATVLWIVGACLLAYAFNLGIEHWIFEPRPFVSHTVHLLLSHAADDSFPSDHTAVSFAIVGMLFFTFPALLFAAGRKRVEQEGRQRAFGLLRPLLFMGTALVLACSIGLARVFVGVHYPGDILGGALSGLCAATVVTLMRRRLARPTDELIHLAERFRLA